MSVFMELYTDRVQPSIEPPAAFPKKLTFADWRRIAQHVEAVFTTQRRLRKAL